MSLFFVGLEDKDGEIEPYIYAADLIGAGLFADDFVVAGTASEALYGLCESLYKPDMVLYILSLFPTDLLFPLLRILMSNIFVSFSPHSKIGPR